MLQWRLDFHPQKIGFLWIECCWFRKACFMVVSVGLGMIGALMAIAANRDDSSYALAMVTGLLTVFSGSYLTVRG